MSIEIKAEATKSGNSDIAVWAENALKNVDAYLPIAVGSSAVSTPAERPIRGSNGPGLEAANDALRGLRDEGKHLRQVWAEAEHWRELARHRGYRLPHWYLPMTPRAMQQVLGSLGLDRQFFREAFGLKTYQQLIDRNPNAPLWAFAGWCLELNQ
jgi:hypothetical protein